MDLRGIFDVFSRRQPQSTEHLTDSFRQRVLMLCDDTLTHPDPGCPPGDYRERFWEEIHKRLTFLLGATRLSLDTWVRTRSDDAQAYLQDCPDEHFLDFIEYIFRVDAYGRVRHDENRMVEEITELFLVDGLPYALSPFVRETRPGVMFGREREVHVVVCYPKVISRDSEFQYSSLVEPAISLLSDEGFSSANSEFIEALEDYRKGDYGDCLTKCASSLESAMKIICARNRWPYRDTDTAATLLRTVLDESGLEPYFEQPLLVVATIRNRLSKSHGSGTELREVPRSDVRFAVNAAASAILLLVERCQESDS